VENLTKLPQPGQKLYVLGSNEQIEVGTLTSVAEPGSTGEPTIVGMALIRRADSVLKQMQSIPDLQMPRANIGGGSAMMDMEEVMRSGGGGGSGIIAPPPMDALDGLEVIVGGTFTFGRLQSIPSRRYPKGKNMFTDEEKVLLRRKKNLDQDYVDIEYSGKSPTEFLEERAAEMEEQSIMEETKDAVVEVEQAKTGDDDDDDDEAKRKAAKMELLKQRADEAMERRKQKKQEAQETMKKEEVLSEDEEAAEARRKAEKMNMLQQRAEEAIARRKKKKEQQG